MTRPVNYTLEWNEEKGNISGTYSDNYYTTKAQVSGSTKDLGRNFTVTFPGESKGVRSLSLLVSNVKDERTQESVPVSIVTRDSKGNPLTTAKASSRFITVDRVAQRQESNECLEGFGELAGFCGVYSGMLTEDQDRRNKCNLLFADAVRLELRSDSSIVLHLGEAGTMVEEPVHEIGRLPSNPRTNMIDVMSRSCRPLPGFNAPGDSCKLLNLRGEFSIRGPNRHFRGNYTIKEEGTNNTCAYGLSMDLQNL